MATLRYAVHAAAVWGSGGWQTMQQVAETLIRAIDAHPFDEGLVDAKRASDVVKHHLASHVPHGFDDTGTEVLVLNGSKLAVDARLDRYVVEIEFSSTGQMSHDLTKLAYLCAQGRADGGIVLVPYTELQAHYVGWDYAQNWVRALYDAGVFEFPLLVMAIERMGLRTDYQKQELIRKFGDVVDATEYELL